jgi:hypothetical protein
MAKFKLGPEPWYHFGEYHQARTIVDIPPDVEPSRTWEPLDEEAEEMLQKLREHDLEKEALKLKAEEARIDIGSLESLITKMADAKVEKVLAQKKAATGHSEKKPKQEPKKPEDKRPEGAAGQEPKKPEDKRPEGAAGQEPKKPEDKRPEGAAGSGRASDQSVA